MFLGYHVFYSNLTVEIGGFSSEINSLIGPYTLEFVSGEDWVLKMQATDILGPSLLAKTL